MLRNLLSRKWPRRLIIAAPFVILAAPVFYLYRHATRAANESVAWQWINAGRTDRARDYVQRAIVEHPAESSSWNLAAALAWKMNLFAISEDDAKRAAFLSHNKPERVLDWAVVAVQRDNLDEARAAIALLPEAFAEASARAQRTIGHLQAKSGHIDLAVQAFERALALDEREGKSDRTSDRYYLGYTLLQSSEPSKLERGRVVLRGLLSDKSYSLEAARSLVQDALAHQDGGALDTLLPGYEANPRFSQDDYLDFCRGMLMAHPGNFPLKVASLENAVGDSPEKIMTLMACLNQIGQAPETLSWKDRLPEKTVRRSPVSIGVAEAYRLCGLWDGLDHWVKVCSWEADFKFLPVVYTVLEARAQGHPLPADQLLEVTGPQLLQNEATFPLATSCLDAWGATDEAIALLEKASQKRSVAYDCLLHLSEIYHRTRNAQCEYSVAERLLAISPSNRDFANDYAYFAAVMGDASSKRVQEVALDNLSAQPDNIYYRATCAFVLAASGKPAEAMRVITPIAKDWSKSRAIAWGYAAALALSGNKERSRMVASTLDRTVLSDPELQWVAAFVQ